jgi:hypothetical protein
MSREERQEALRRQFLSQFHKQANERMNNLNQHHPLESILPRKEKNSYPIKEEEEDEDDDEEEEESEVKEPVEPYVLLEQPNDVQRKSYKNENRFNLFIIFLSLFDFC